ncbi:MAG: UDP-3-O-(3-hydroxymyristoyl)glucosamine N-acyltransferase [Marinoscillum sp.]
MKLTASEIAELLNGEVVGTSTPSITHISEIQEAEPGSVTFLSNPKYLKHLKTTSASAIIVGDKLDISKYPDQCFIQVNDPYEAITLLLETYERLAQIEKKGKEDPHFLGENSSIGHDHYVGAFAYIGEGVEIGNHVKIYPHAYIGDGSKIGDHTIIYAGAKIYPKTIIGKYCNIHAGAVIGSHGFGFAPIANGSYKNIPQTGNVVLGDHVDIGANTTIDCATIGTTRIADGVKIDNLVQIAHNVSIGENTVIASQTGISGSASIGKQVMIGGQVGTVGHIHIADYTKVGARSGVTKNTKSDQILFGVPAIDRNEYLKSYAIYRKLPEVMKRIQELEGKILNLASGN